MIKSPPHGIKLHLQAQLSRHVCSGRTTFVSVMDGRGTSVAGLEQSRTSEWQFISRQWDVHHTFVCVSETDRVVVIAQFLVGGELREKNINKSQKTI